MKSRSEKKHRKNSEREFETDMSSKLYTPVNPRAQQCVRNVLKYLSDISCDKIVAGQHTQTTEMEELHHIRAVTGREPALLGFELLSYSPNINYLDTDADCMTEVVQNYGTLKNAWAWAAKKGLITFTWHWFSPLGGRSKSFYSINTDFDASLAVTDGTPENRALLSDMDVMAGLLRPFCDRGVPILWRPFHEGDGDWFWWGAGGAETVRKLWHIMFDRYTNIHGLNNLIWVWNSQVPACYPGDDTVDIISRDMYPDKHVHTSQSEMYCELLKITDQPKIALIGETGTVPDADAIHAEKIGWASYMTWSKGFCLSEEYTSAAQLKRLYDSPNAVTLDRLPELY